MKTTQTYRGRDVLSLEYIEVDVVDGRFADIRKSDHANDNIWLCPGLVDLQVNGYGGIDLNDLSCDAASVARLTATLASLGTTTFLPTVITASHEAMIARVRTIAEARKKFPSVKHAVPCIHLEGPSISPLDGYRGAHPLADVREPSLAELDTLQEAADGLIGMVTISPHWPSAKEYIRSLTEAGIVVALGHTHASPDMIQAAVDAGAQLSTHLGNGIAAELQRHPNPIWSQLADDRLTATLIADGVHLPSEVLRAIMRAKGLDQVVLVSDSVSLAGSKPGRYHSPIGGDVVAGQDGSIRMFDGGLLAGSGIALKDAVAYVAGLPGYTLSAAFRMATINPARFLKGRNASIEIGEPADLIVMQWLPEDGVLDLVEVFAMGVPQNV